MLKEFEHNSHAGNQAGVESQEALTVAKLRALETRDPTSVIVAEAAVGLNKAAAAKMPSVASTSRSLRRVRATANPVPMNPTSRDFDIPAEYTTLDGGEKFLFFDSRDHGVTTHRTLIYATEENLSTLETCETWFADGTFDCAPKVFSQLYTIHGEVNRQALPLVYILTTSKSQAVYTEILNQLKRMNPRLRPRSIMSDFELAFLLAANDVFGRNLCRGCFFHFCQCVWREIQRCGLQVEFFLFSLTLLWTIQSVILLE